MIDKKIQPDYSIKEEKLRLHAALPLLAPAVAKAIGAALGLTGTGLVLQKQIQNYFANNPGALDSIVSTFGTKPGDQPEVEEELKELTKPTTTPIETWEKSFADTGTKVPEKLPEAKGIEVPPQEKVAPPGFQKAEPLGTDILTKDITKDVENREIEIAEGLEKYEEIYSEETFKELNEKHPELSPANNKKTVEADKHFGAHALKYFTDAETQLIYLTPQEYLDLTESLDKDKDWSRARIKYLEGKIKDGKEIGEIPKLMVSKDGNNYKKDFRNMVS